MNNKKRRELERQLEAAKFNRDGIKFMIEVQEWELSGNSSRNLSEEEREIMSKSLQEKRTRLEEVEYEITTHSNPSKLILTIFLFF